jgi:hypothetical protein
MTGLRHLRLQVMLSKAELSVIDDFRFTHRLPTRAAAVQELLKRGLSGSIPPSASEPKSSRYGVIRSAARDAPRSPIANDRARLILSDQNADKARQSGIMAQTPVRRLRHNTVTLS